MTKPNLNQKIHVYIFNIDFDGDFNNYITKNEAEILHILLNDDFKILDGRGNLYKHIQDFIDKPFLMNKEGKIKLTIDEPYRKNVEKQMAPFYEKLYGITDITKIRNINWKKLLYDLELDWKNGNPLDYEYMTTQIDYQKVKSIIRQYKINQISRKKSTFS